MQSTHASNTLYSWRVSLQHWIYVCRMDASSIFVTITKMQESMEENARESEFNDDCEAQLPAQFICMLE